MPPSLHLAFGLVTVLAPLSLLGAMGAASLVERPFSERLTVSLVYWSVVAGLTSAIGVLVMMLTTNVRHVPIDLGNWVALPHYHFSLKLVFDRLSVPLVILTYLLGGTIGAFAGRYLHREAGFNRFFVLYAVFLVGMALTSLAGTIETLFMGWELVGISSALLVAFFQERQSPVRNGLRVWSVYRVSDAALLLAAIVLHHLRGEGDFDVMSIGGSWPESHTILTSGQALGVGLLLLVAAAGKSALVPFSGWLPRAMEGPTPSSAVFYGALSVHLGAYLLLRVSPLLEQSLLLCACIVAVGLATALFAALAGRVQTDVKSMLSFASLTQVGLIVAEIGFGLRYIALVHLLGHACLRTLQFLRAGSLLQDYHALENAIGSRLSRGEGALIRALPSAAQTWLYRFALERGYFDSMLQTWVAAPFLRVFQMCDGLERRFTEWLSGPQSRESDRLRPEAGSVGELS